MAEKTQPGTYIVLGFGVCALLLCTMSVIGYNGVVMQHRVFDECSTQAEANTRIHHAARQFDAMRRTTERFRQTGDEKLLTDEHFKEAMGSLEEAGSWFSSPENMELTDMLQSQLQDYRKLSEESVMLSQKQREISNDVLKFFETLDKRIHEAVSSNKELQPLLEIAGRWELCRVKAITAPTEQARAEWSKRPEEQFTRFHERIHEARKNIEIPGEVKKLDDIMAHADEYHKAVHESFRWQHESEARHAEAEQLATEAEMRFEELQKCLEERQDIYAKEYEIITVRVIHLIVICSAVSLIICIFTGFFVSRKLQPKRNEIDPYASQPENMNRDLSIVADKLQEVVDLLRR